MKRTAHIALVVMAAAGVGGVGYAMMPREDCVRSDGGAPVDPSEPACRTSSGSGHGSHGIWHSYGGSSSGSSSSTSTAPSTAFASPSAGTTHGGFGSFAHAIAAHAGG